MHKKAKKSDSQEDWRQYRSQHNIVNNLKKNKKYNYLKHQLNISKNNNTYSDDTDYVSDKIMWKNVKNITSNNKQVPPRAISHNGKLITSIKEICNIANNHYIFKILKIRNKFLDNISVTPLDILSS